MLQVRPRSDQECYRWDHTTIENTTGETTSWSGMLQLRPRNQYERHSTSTTMRSRNLCNGTIRSRKACRWDHASNLTTVSAWTSIRSWTRYLIMFLDHVAWSCCLIMLLDHVAWSCYLIRKTNRSHLPIVSTFHRFHFQSVNLIDRSTLVYQYIRPMVPPGFPGKCHLPGRISRRLLVDFVALIFIFVFLDICVGFWLPVVDNLWLNSHHFSIDFPSMDVPLRFLKVWTDFAYILMFLLTLPGRTLIWRNPCFC